MLSNGPSYLSHRLENLYQKLKELNLDSLFISQQNNITYLTGFYSRDSYLLIKLLPKKKDLKGFFITDFRYWQEAKQLLRGFCLKKINGSFFDLVVKLSKYLKLNKLGFEAKSLSYAEYEKIKNALSGNNIEFIPTYDIVESLREVKSAREIKKIKMATKINLEAFQYAEKIIKPGLSERQVAFLLEEFIKKRGAKSAFEPIVAAGVNSSFPHHITGDYKLKKNELVLIDMGVDFEGYKSDLTRIFFLGKIPSIIIKINEIVKKAQKLSLEAIKPNITIDKIDKTARNYIKDRGYGRFFGHALGHGVGLDIHEGPYISSKNKNTIRAGMVFTLEPAIYLPERFGIRIEDMIWFDGKKAEVLSAIFHK